MITILQIVVALLCLLFLLYVFRLVAKEKLQLKYSLLWIVLTLVILLCALFPGPLFQVAQLFGFETPSNFIFVVGLFFLMAICLSLSAIVSKQKTMIKNLVQDQALLARKIKDLEEGRSIADHTTNQNDET